MSTIFALKNISNKIACQVGGKALALARLYHAGVRVPETICLTTAACRDVLSVKGLGEKIQLELHRKKITDMRWEEMWDTSLRIRNLFLQTDLPKQLDKELRKHITRCFQRRPVVVRSSALGEDSANISFAGLHESFVNIRGATSIIKHIKLVWASLWSDAALLYRRDLNLDMEKSGMGVVVQALISGDCSGIVFEENPLDRTQTVIEAVFGLNQGLVDGTIEPDRWLLQKRNGSIISHRSAVHTRAVVPGRNGIKVKRLTPTKHSPLTSSAIKKVFALAKTTGQIFGVPQDVEWTFQGARLFALQSRPITVSQKAGTQDSRAWYLSLRRSLENLKALRIKIERTMIPAMEQEAGRLAAKDLSDLSDRALAREIRSRKSIFKKWADTYQQDFIPFAHGVRLFGQVYNSKMQPDDPFEFVELLRPHVMQSLERNDMLDEMAAILKKDKKLAAALHKKQLSDLNRMDRRFITLFRTFLDEYGNLEILQDTDKNVLSALVPFLLEWSNKTDMSTKRTPATRRRSTLEQAFLASYTEQERAEMRKLLDLARASYTMRDDDNIYLGRIERQLIRAQKEAKKRLKKRSSFSPDNLTLQALIKTCSGSQLTAPKKTTRQSAPLSTQMQARQIMGQPAGQGLASGKARVIHRQSDLLVFKRGEVLVCDAIEPNMTFVVPLASAIVERRGGMLIHGAIIAREYGVPCVTGIPDLTALVHTGDRLTVDGYLGIVVIQQRPGNIQHGCDQICTTKTPAPLYREARRTKK